MFTIAYATPRDMRDCFLFDRHLTESQYELKVRDKMYYITRDGDTPIGVMRYNLFWDYIPFLTLIHFGDTYQRKGYGTKAMQHWESEMRALGHKIIMTSTQADEQGQHFYRKLGYKDTGCLVLDDQPLEIFMIKAL